MTKCELRSFFRAMRSVWCRQFPEKRRHADARINMCCSKLPQEGVWGVFSPLEDEPQIWPFLHNRIDQDLPIAFPRLDKNELIFHIWSPDTPLIPHKWGMLEPPAEAPCILPDVLLVPLLACDQKGIRLGQGKGFYDRFLKTLRAQKECIALGIAFDCQITSELLRDPWDEPLDLLWTESQVLIFGTRELQL